MTRTWSGVATLVALALVVGCSDDSGVAGLEICDNGKDDDGNGLTDCADPECARRLQRCQADAALPDLAPPDATPRPDVNIFPVALQTVADRLLLPQKSTDYGHDFDGDGKPDNKLGALLGALKGINNNLDVQADLDMQIKSGQLLLLHEVLSASLQDAKPATLRAFFGKDLDTNPADNFSGTEEFELAAVTSTKTQISGSVVGGKATFGPGDLTAPLAIGKVYVVLTLKKAYVKADLSAKGMANGRMYGAIPITVVKDRLLPALALELNTQYKNPSSPQAKKLLEYFDKDLNSEITLKELLADPLIKGLLLDAPDVDTDGDNKKDGISVGLGFSSVPCVIKKGIN